MFEISLESQPKIDADGQQYLHGSIALGDFRETFRAPSSYWSRSGYLKHWNEALRRIVAGADRSCLITGALDPKTANFITCWPLWREGETVFARQRLIFMDKLRKPLSLDDPYWVIPPRRRKAGSDRPSEWAITVKDVSDFLDSQR